MKTADAVRDPSARGNRSRALHLLAIPCILAYAGLAARGDLREAAAPYIAAHAALVVGMLAAWRVTRGKGTFPGRAILLWALAFRLAAAWGGPAMSDDLYRYVWDGRVQLAGIHPYAFAPDDPALAPVRDDVWALVNHPDVPTIYPPVAQIWFLALAALGLGPAGFQVAAGLLDFGVACVVLALLRALRLPEHRVVLYAWNPLAVLESAGSGHLEPLAVGLATLAVLGIATGRARSGAVSLGLAIQAKLLPVVLVPGMVRRMKAPAVAALAAAVVLPALPYAITGPVLGGGVSAFASRWERNASVYAVVEGACERVDTAARFKPAIAAAQRRWPDAGSMYDWMYRHVWPREVARGIVGLLAVLWLSWLAFRRRMDAPTESLWALGGVLLLVPTVHPWYLLWILPLAAAAASPGWLLWAALVPLAYLGGAGDVPVWARALEYVPPAIVLAVESRRALRRSRS